ncbi:MAG: SRPBCC family protein [Flavobacteriia bacterium]|nr:SRPBCC family protein [Flavobacteriia bacterium]OIP48333.1 MAG: orotate phosphoribosyltransferase [Flavobacteriaceae bacterium CG2_30_31_66]PIV96280.1 MAG: orotate phosphoribosyltransferase [Flavobacteriaceae bacterium CG17_big_fil_post_rev_8_21_14_2_50_31_13]PIX12673.1 MAG: orotate phosphoribosyltransferase [Flavobacteriaceae bacterium CG_4_8_14_3_um_filter_31_8]PIY13540.1 MAG: orotate phosphoribosyltransferase [Flavobacteriaceae bacterium CG_4_10_14_3_um_filter_31_253]PIZ09417.1 MAG: orot
MNINGKKVVVQKSQQALYEFLSDLKNFEKLMPESIQKFEVEGDSFLFGLKGMPEIRLVLKEKTPYSNITLGAASSKLDFQLVAGIAAIDANSCEAQLDFNGEFNAMMAMMVKKPLTTFIETLTENMEKL